MATFGVTSTYGVTAPAGYTQSAEKMVEVEVATIKGTTGLTVVAQAKPRSKTTITVRSKGEAVLAVVPVGSDYTAITVTSAKFSETNDDFPTSEVTATLFE